MNTARPRLLQACLVLACLALLPAQAQITPEAALQSRRNLQSITVPLPEHYKLYEGDFYANYVFDDTSRALVNLFFKKRANTRWGFMGSCLGLMGVSLAGSKVETVCVTKPTLGTCLAEKQRVYQPWATPVVLAGMAGSLVYVIVRKSTFSKKNLLLQLMAYEKGQPLPPKTRQRLAATYFQEIVY